QLRGELSLEALELAAGENRVAALEAQPDAVGLAEHAGRKRPGAVTKLERQVGASVASRQPILAHARVATLEPLAGTQLGDRCRRHVAGWDRHRRFHNTIVNVGPDAPAAGGPA